MNGNDRGQGRVLHSASKRSGVSLNGILALVCGVGLLLVRDGLVDSANENHRDSINVLAWVGATALLLIGVREVLWHRMRRARPGQGRRVRRAPREGLYYLALMAALLVGSFLGGENLLMLVVALMIGAWLLNANASGLLLWKTDVRRVAPGRVMVGEVVSVELVVSNRKRFLPALLLLGSDQIENDEELLEARALFSRVPPGEDRSGYYRLRPGRRGRYQLGPVELSTRFPLGLIEQGVVLHCPGEIRVYPRLGRVVPGWYCTHLEAASVTSQTRRRRGVADVEFQRLREFRDGDRPGAVHWRTSARRGELMVREFDEQQQQDLDIVLDLWQPPSPTADDRDRVELAISVAATLCVETLQESAGSVVLAVAGRTVSRLGPLIGARSLDVVLDLLATVQPGIGELPDEILAAPGVVGSPAVLISTRPGEDICLGENGRDRRVITADWNELRGWFWIEDS